MQKSIGDSVKTKVGEAGFEQLGYICKDIDLYNLIENLGIGHSAVGEQMDTAGRWLFNHRFGGGHLWWHELLNRPISEWKDVIDHLASDFFTPAGLPYAFDGSMTKGKLDLLKIFASTKSIENWGMINGFEFAGGTLSLTFSTYQAGTLKYGYDSNLAFALDGLFVGLNIIGGIATANPLLIVAAIIKTSTLIRKASMPLGIISSSPFDVNQNVEFDFNMDAFVKVKQFMSLNRSFDYAYRGNVLSTTI